MTKKTKPAKAAPEQAQEPAFFQATYDLNSSELLINYNTVDCVVHVHMNSRKVQKLFGDMLKKNWIELIPAMGMYAQQMRQTEACKREERLAKKAKKDKRTQNDSFCGGIDKQQTKAKRVKKTKKTAKPSPASPPAP